MPIVPYPMPNLTPRDNVLIDLAMMIDEAASSLQDSDPYVFASLVLEFIEAKVNSVDPEGTVIYRA